MSDDDTMSRSGDESVSRTVEAVWRLESARVVATLARYVGDLDWAEDLAQEALAQAIAKWPTAGIPSNGGAWLTTVAKRKAIDEWRRRDRLDARIAILAQELEADEHSGKQSWDPARIDDDVLRLVFISCHPVLSRAAQVALTLRVVGGLATDEIARALLVPVATARQRIVRAKKTLSAARVPFELPDPSSFPARLGSVLEVVYLVFNEGYAATSGSAWMRVDLAGEALRLGRLLADLLPREPEVHALLALMELQASRFDARMSPTGDPVLLPDQDRSRWDHIQIARGLDALGRADRLGAGRGPYALQAAIAECHAIAATTADTDWGKIVLLYEALGQISPSPVVELNRAVAVSMATGPATALMIVDRVAEEYDLSAYVLLPAIRGDLLLRLGRQDEARAELATAARLTNNDKERAILLAKMGKELQ
jgi:RNA polymerase sigma factor (sigma-70 family)